MNNYSGNVVRTGQTRLGSANRVPLGEAAGRMCLVRPLDANNNDIYIGGDNVTTANGFPLANPSATNPGGYTPFPVNNASALFIIGTSGDGVAWMMIG